MALLVGGILFVVCAGMALGHAAGPCHDVRSGAAILVRASIGPRLPIAMLQLCDHAIALATAYYAGYVIAGVGTILLLRSELSVGSISALTVTAVLAAMAVPFLPNSDAYAYALYAYELHVLHLTPYVAQHFQAGVPLQQTLNALFPEPANPERIVAYGPAFAALYGLVAGPFGRVSLFAMIMAERVFGAVMLLALGLLVCGAARPDLKKRAFIAVVLNPLMLFESVSFCHGDAVMLTILAAAFLSYLRQRISLAAILCVLASEVRIVAVVALAVLMVELTHGRRFRALMWSAASALGAAALTGIVSQAAFGTFRLSTAPAFYSSVEAPAVMAAAALGGTSAAVLMAGVAAQAGAGAFALYAAMRQRAYVLVPVALIAALPVFQAWYAQWLVPFTAVTRNTAFRWSGAALFAVAPLNEMADMVAIPRALSVRAAIVLLVWAAPIATYAFIIVRQRAEARRRILELCS